MRKKVAQKTITDTPQYGQRRSRIRKTAKGSRNDVHMLPSPGYMA